jgi:hypothetical protein
MYRHINIAALMVLLVLVGTAWGEDTNSIESISIDFPHGETRLLVQRNGESFLFYGALPQYQKIKNNTFDIDELYKQLQERLRDNVPREQWPNPKSRAGMVQIRFQDKHKRDYLIFDEDVFAERLFSKARKNAVLQMQ